MKKILLTMAAAFIMSATAFAQGGFGGGQFDPEQMIKMRTDRTVEQYKLNAEQAKQLLELNTKYNDRLMGGFGRMGGGRRGGQGGPGGGMGPGGGGFGQGGQMPQLTDEQRAQMEESRKKREEAQKEYDAELEKIMTPEQFKQYQEDQKNRRQRGGGGFGGGQRGPRPQGQPNV